MSYLLIRRDDLEGVPPLPELPEGYALRLFIPADREPLAELLKSAFEDAEWTLERVDATLINDPDVKRIYILETQGRRVGSVAALIQPDSEPVEGHIRCLAVHPDFRGKRLGALLAIACLHTFRELGAKTATISVDEKMPFAIKLCRSLGFEPDHEDSSHVERWTKILSDLLAAANL